MNDRCGDQLLIQVTEHLVEEGIQFKTNEYQYKLGTGSIFKVPNFSFLNL